MRTSRAFALALLLGAASLAAAPSSEPVLPFIEDDYGKALSEARAKKVPIFVEAWAPW
jgi:hypothetical protein